MSLPDLPAALRHLVVNRHVTKAFDVYVGRPSIWGNPHPVTGPADRIEAIVKYEADLRARPEMMARVKRELRGKVLGCWCAPAVCHGEVLARIANEEEKPVDQEQLPFDKPAPPKTALILDTETSGLPDDPKAVVVEVAAILYNLEFGTPIESYACIIRRAANTIVDPFIARLTGIFDDDLRLGREPTAVWEHVVKMSCAADVILAHNANFDRRMCEDDIVFAQQCVDYWAKPRPWVCTMTHVEWPDREMGAPKSLAAIALHYGVGVISAHRAMTDCDILARTLTRIKELGHDLPTLIASAMVPRVKVQAVNLPFEKKQLAKDAGFAWDGENKRWWREVTVEQRAKLPFQTREIK